MMVVLKAPDVGERLKSLSGEPRPMTPDQARDFVRGEISRFGVLMRKLDIKVTD